MSTDARRIQSILNRASHKVDITGEWNRDMCAALVAFQEQKWGSRKNRYFDSETWLELGFDPRTADEFEAKYGHICGGVTPPGASYGNTVGVDLSGQVKRVQRALRVRETGRFDERTCEAISSLARNMGVQPLSRDMLIHIGFTGAEAAKLAEVFMLACTARGRQALRGVGYAKPGFAGFAGDEYGQSDQNIDDYDDLGFDDVSEDPADTTAVWNNVLPSGQSWCTATPTGLRIVNDWVNVSSAAGGIKRRQWSDNNGAAHYQYWRGLTNEERWSCPKQTVTPQRVRLIKLMQETLLDLDYAIGTADGKAGPKTCQAAYVEQGRLGMCGQELLQKGFFESLGFSKSEVQEAWNEISGACRGYYSSAYDCAAPVKPEPPKPEPTTPVTPVKPSTPTTPPAPSGQKACSGQPAGSTRTSGPSPMTGAYSGWTKETFKSGNGALSTKYYHAAQKITKWFCGAAPSPVKPIPQPIPDPPKPDEPAGWGWVLGGGLVVLAAGIFLFNKTPSGRRRR
jgi:hypothetical protein